MCGMWVFQSLLSWMSLLNSDTYHGTCLLVAFQSLLSWMSLLNWVVVAGVGRAPAVVSILVILDVALKLLGRVD